MTKTPADLGIEAAKKDDAERAYKAAYYTHSVSRIQFRAGSISAEALTNARKAHEAFIFGGTDNECHY